MLKAQRRQEDREGVERFIALCPFFAALRLGVRPPFALIFERMNPPESAWINYGLLPAASTSSRIRWRAAVGK